MEPQDLLRQRAEQYAKPIQRETGAVDAASILTFDLGHERYGIDVSCVRSVRPAPAITPIPNTPVFYRGVVNLRGKIITVLDLRAFFGMEAADIAATRELIVVNAAALELAVLAQHVHGVDAVPLSTIQPIESIRYARGVTPDRLIILNIEQLFEDERLIIGGDPDA